MEISCRLPARIFPETGAPAVLVTDQAFTIYQTLYYNGVAPDGYSARPE